MEAWAFFHHGKDQTQAERCEHAGREGKKGCGAAFETTLILGAMCGSYEEQEKKKSSSHPQMATQSNANVKRTHMTAKSTCEKEHSAQGTRWVYRWLYVQGDDGEPITNVSVSSYFQGQNHLCVLKQLRTLHSHLFRTFIFAVMKYRRIQNEHFCLFEIKSFFRLLKTLAGEQIKRFGQMKRVLPFTALRLLLPPSDYFTFCSLGDDLNDKSSAEL